MNLLSRAQNDRFGVAAKSLNLSMSTGRKVIVVDLNSIIYRQNKSPYRIQTKQKLTAADKKDMAEKNQKFEWAPHSPDFSPQLPSPGVI